MSRTALYALLLFVMFGDRLPYIALACTTLNWEMLWLIGLTMITPLVVGMRKPTVQEWRKAQQYSKRKRAYPYHRQGTL